MLYERYKINSLFIKHFLFAGSSFSGKKIKAKMRNIESRGGNKTNRLPEQMGARSQEVSPVGAWVQPATGLSLDASVSALFYFSNIL